MGRLEALVRSCCKPADSAARLTAFAVFGVLIRIHLGLYCCRSRLAGGAADPGHVHHDGPVCPIFQGTVSAEVSALQRTE